ncbi:hypothetical protein [Methylomonas methanica]|nr:hypothetical protein [Methylomonas methanica]
MNYSACFSVILLGFSNIVHADDQLTDPERSSVSLLSSIMDIIISKIDNSSCYEMRGRYPLKLFATGVVAQRRQNNMATVKLADHAVSVVAYPKNKIPDIGSQIITVYTRTSDYNIFDPVKNYDAIYSFNATADRISMVSNLELFLNYNYLTTQEYSAEANISFQFSETSDITDAVSSNRGEGISQLSISETQKARYQQRLRITRDDGTNAHTLFLRDLLSYRQTCRIKAEMVGRNGMGSVSQDGYLTIDMSWPDDPVVLYF